MFKILLTINEDKSSTSDTNFGITYKVDEHDCLDYARGLAERGHDVYFINWNDFDGAEFRRMFHHNGQRFLDSPLRLREIDLVWVYQMEGFYFDMPRFFAMVDRFADQCGLVINDPRTIRHNTNKSYLFELERVGVRIIPTWEFDETIAGRIQQGERFVLKPKFGERGNGIELATSVDDLQKIAGKEQQYLVQKFMPSVREGEKSLVFLGLDFQHAVIKRPNPVNESEFRCNESLGGTVSVYEPNENELDYARGVLKGYEALGCPVRYSRVDFVDSQDGPCLVEAEVLNPAAFANYSKKGKQFGEKVAQYVEKLIEGAHVHGQRS